VLALYIVVGILLVIVLVLSVPVDLVFDFKTGGEGKALLRVEWLFGLVGKRLLPRRKREKPKKAEKTRKKRWGVGSFLSYISLARTRGVVPAFITLVRRMLGSFHIRQFEADLQLGLDDPADMGVVYGLLWPAFVLPIRSSSTTLRVQPVFGSPTFEAALQGKVRVFPAEMVTNVLRFVFSPAGLRLIKAMAVLRWKKKK
jgi:hypothetical protein